MSSSDFANVYASINNLEGQFNNITGNTLSNYNQLSRIVSQQSNIYDTIYYGIGNLTTGFLSVSNNASVLGNIIGTSNLIILNGNIGLGTSSPTSTLHVVGNARITSNVDINNILNSISINNSGNITTVYGIGLGTSDNATSGGVLTNSDNYSGGVFSDINFGITGSYLPRGIIPRQIKFMMTKQLTAGVATTVLTLTHTALATDEGSFAISFNGIFHASNATDSSARAYQLLAVGTRKDGGAFVTTQAAPGSSLISTTPATLALAGIAYTWPTLTSTTSTLALNQTVTGTASQALLITGEWTITHSSSNGGLFLTGIS